MVQSWHCKRAAFEPGAESFGQEASSALTFFCLLAGEVQAFYEDLNGRQYMNEVFSFSVDKLYDLLFTDSQFQRDFMEQRRFSGEPHAVPVHATCPVTDPGRIL